MTDKPKPYGYLICCMNNWCWGPEIFRLWCLDESEPPDTMHCPTCGWLAARWDKASYRAVTAEEAVDAMLAQMGV